jgi:hypothetical protein
LISTEQPRAGGSNHRACFRNREPLTSLRVNRRLMNRLAFRKRFCARDSPCSSSDTFAVSATRCTETRADPLSVNRSVLLNVGSRRKRDGRCDPRVRRPRCESAARGAADGNFRVAITRSNSARNSCDNRRYVPEDIRFPQSKHRPTCGAQQACVATISADIRSDLRRPIRCV